ncbi:MAG TPA: nitronate monooxygenase [Phototrophicaceae bacterium]|nr:nitronate monooxygenase [Phototrophicaceae bacterium]
MNKLPRIIQGGMGVAISTWHLANTVSKLGQLGIISGTGIVMVLTSRLMAGDKDGAMRRALAHFPFQSIVQDILDKYYVEGGIGPDEPFKRQTMWTHNPPPELNILTVVANFVEVWLAKQGHSNPVGINLLEKVQLPNLASLYGAMLAGVDVVIMGAGIPLQIPGVLDDLAEHQDVSYRLDVEGAEPDDDFRIHLKPQELFPGIVEKLGALKRPDFFPVISSVVLGQALLKRATGKVNGFVVELPIAGGHNAPPRGGMQLNELGEPLYGPKDEVRLDRIADLGVPFWIGGGYGSAEMYRQARAVGAAGIQVGTAFAYCNESGMAPQVRAAVIQRLLNGEDVVVYTDPRISPTGYPFKVVQIEDTLAVPAVYQARPRICDVGFLRTAYKTANGTLDYRCASEPIDTYLKKGGQEADTEGRGCLCNGLGAAAGYPQHQKNGYIEPVILTSGNDLPNITQFFKPGQENYTAQDVIESLLMGESAS